MGNLPYPIGDQLFVHTEEPCEERFSGPDPGVETLKSGELTPDEIFEEAGHRVRMMKPHGAGLWTSTRIEGAACAWTDFLQGSADNLQKGGERVWQLTPADDVDVYVLDSLDAVREVSALLEEETFTYETVFTKEEEEGISRRYGIDFYTLSQEYDAVWLPGPVVDELRLPGIENPELTAWDVESTVWLNWCFEDVELVAEELPPTSPRMQVVE